MQHEHTPEQEEEYLAVLKRQAVKLKKLTEDLVEVSKATTGNLPVNAVRCSMNELLSQVEGEYGDKLSAAELTLVSVMPDKELFCNVDGALMWRVIDNLLSNICKYAQNGTRVYLTLEKTGGDAVVTFKNTSRAALNIPAEELMERFVRGDSSRSTEGNGLGLSIAQSLTELQGGKMSLASMATSSRPSSVSRRWCEKNTERCGKALPLRTFSAPVLDNSAQKQYNNSSELYPETEGEHKHGKR